MKDIKSTELELKILRLEIKLNEMTRFMSSLVEDMGKYVEYNNEDKKRLKKALFNRTKNVDKALDILFSDYEARENEYIEEFFKRYQKKQKYLM